MDRMPNAIHEGAHLIVAHYQQIEVTKIGLNGIGFVPPSRPEDKPEEHEKPGYVGRYYPPLSYQQKLKKWWYGYVHLMASGAIAEFMFSGDQAFWEANPKTTLMKNSDMIKLEELDPNKAMREGTKQSLYGIAGFLSSDAIWGKVTVLADAILDNNKELAKKDKVFGQVYKAVLMKTDRKRKPQYEASPLIEFILSELYRN